jgi:hypothetical protein
MKLQVTSRNEQIALELLADGHDVRAIWRDAGFRNLTEARAYARLPETRDEVERLVADRLARLSARSVARLGELIESKTTDGRTIVAASRTLMEAAGRFRRDSQIPLKQLRELSAAELGVLIAETRAELEQARAKYGIALTQTQS